MACTGENGRGDGKRDATGDVLYEAYIFMNKIACGTCIIVGRYVDGPDNVGGVRDDENQSFIHEDINLYTRGPPIGTQLRDRGALYKQGYRD